LTGLDQRKSLSSNISDFLSAWAIEESADQFVLLFDGCDNLMVTEKNRSEIKDGTMLRVAHSPSRRVADLLQQVRESIANETQKELYEQLATLCLQTSFAIEFVAQGGMQLLIESIGNQTSFFI
jgi:engulfment/cell motility protein 1